MNILHISHSDSIGGANIAASRLSDALNQNEIKSSQLVRLKKTNKKEVTTINKSSINREINFLRRYFSRLICTLFDFNPYNTKSTGILPSFVSKKINSSKYDLVHLHWIGQETISLNDIKSINKPIIWTFHDLWPISGAEHISFNNTYLNENFDLLKK